MLQVHLQHKYKSMRCTKNHAVLGVYMINNKSQKTRKEPQKKLNADVPADLQRLLVETQQTCAARE